MTVRSLEVDAGDLAEDDPRVLLAGQHLAGARRDLALGEDAGGDLVQQRLEQVVRGAGDEGDLDVVTPGEGAGAEEAAEAGADDDDAMGLGRVGGGHVGSNPCGRRPIIPVGSGCAWAADGRVAPASPEKAPTGEPVGTLSRGSGGRI